MTVKLKRDFNMEEIDNLPKDIRIGFIREDLSIIRAWLTVSDDARWANAKNVEFKSVPDSFLPGYRFYFEGTLDVGQC